jgi:hypothetical protein
METGWSTAAVCSADDSDMEEDTDAELPDSGLEVLRGLADMAAERARVLPLY